MKIHGFSLIELLLVMAMMAILLMLAYPSYQTYLRNAERNKAEVELLRLSERMNEYHSEHDSYLGASIYAFGIDEQQNNYQFNIVKLEAQMYLIVAHPINTQIQDHCGNLSINEQGARSAKQENCW